MPVWLFLRGLFMVLITASRPTFVLGHTYPHGVWFYYPVVFLLKSPLGFLGLLLLALGIALFRKGVAGQSTVTNTNEARVHWRVLWVSLIVFTAVDLLSRLDISIRHFTVPVILIILLLAPLPAMLRKLRATASLFATVTIALVVILAGNCLFTAVRTYPYYFPYVNSLSFGRPIYTLMNDSNVDWNQSIPEVKRFAEQHGLQKIALDWYGLTDSTKDVPGAYEWNCQQPSASDGGQWAVVSANLILDSHNCPWLLMYPHESLAGGSMLAVHLPQTIPSAGSPGGPPPPSQYHAFFGFPLFDIRAMFLNLSKDPDKIPDTYARMEQGFKRQAEEQKKHGKEQSPH